MFEEFWKAQAKRFGSFVTRPLLMGTPDWRVDEEVFETDIDFTNASCIWVKNSRLFWQPFLNGFLLIRSWKKKEEWHAKVFFAPTLEEFRMILNVQENQLFVF